MRWMIGYWLPIVVAMSAGCALNCHDGRHGESVMSHAMQPYLDSGELPGAISVLYDNGREEVSLIGYADLRTKRQISIDDPFQQCSQTKGFCGVVVAKLIEEGRLCLDDPISKYLPAFAGNPGFIIGRRNADGVMPYSVATNAITLRMCMNHSAGFDFELKNFSQMGGWNHRMPLQSVAAVAISQPLKFQPGEQVLYSNVGIDVAAAVVEKVTGLRFEEYLKKVVLDPLEMTETTFQPTEDQIARRICIFRQREGDVARFEESSAAMQSPFNGNSVFTSAGAGLWTTARDQLKFYKMLMNLGVGDNGVRILNEETVKNYLVRSTRSDRLHLENNGYSLGLVASKDGVLDSWIGHGGALNTECFVNPAKKQLKLWVVQADAPRSKWVEERPAVEAEFFNDRTAEDTSDYTGRLH